MEIYHNVNDYMNDLTNLVWNYINYPEQYPENAQLAVQPEIMVNVIDDPSQCKYCDFYNIDMLICKDNMGQTVPNVFAIKKVANRYYNVG